LYRASSSSAFCVFCVWVDTESATIHNSSYEGAPTLVDLSADSVEVDLTSEVSPPSVTLIQFEALLFRDSETGISFV
jgi:hypothetical protein